MGRVGDSHAISSSLLCIALIDRIQPLRRCAFGFFQITYYGLHQFFLTERAIYVIVWDATKFEGLSQENLDQVSWILEASFGCPPSRIGSVTTSVKHSRSCGVFG